METTPTCQMKHLINAQNSTADALSLSTIQTYRPTDTSLRWHISPIVQPPCYISGKERDGVRKRKGVRKGWRGEKRENRNNKKSQRQTLLDSHATWTALLRQPLVSKRELNMLLCNAKTMTIYNMTGIVWHYCTAEVIEIYLNYIQQSMCYTGCPHTKRDANIYSIPFTIIRNFTQGFINFVMVFLLPTISK